MKTKSADLHIHTTYSDGTLSPREAVEYAKKIGLGCIAICDHDSVKGVGEALSAAQDTGVEVVPAVEVSAEEDSRELHMLGYYIDYNDTELQSGLKQIRDDRIRRLYKMADALNSCGFKIDADDVIRFAGDVSLSRLHLARYMEKKELVSSWKEAFRRYIGDNGPCYVASFRLSSKEAIDLIKDAKGIPVIAHPGLNRIEADGLMAKLIKQGIKGIEVYHSDHRPSDSKRYQIYAREHGLIATGGSDCHGRLKGRMLMGTITVPYSCVEELKRVRTA